MPSGGNIASEEMARLTALLFAHISASAAQIELHGIFAARESSEASAQVAAAREIACIITTYGTGRDGTTSSTHVSAGAMMLPNLHPRRLHLMIGVRFCPFEVEVSIVYHLICFAVVDFPRRWCPPA